MSVVAWVLALAPAAAHGQPGRDGEPARRQLPAGQQRAAASDDRLPAVIVPVAGRAASEDRTVADPGARPRRKLRTAAWISLGAAGLLLGTGVVFDLAASDAEDDMRALSRARDPATGLPLAYDGEVRARYEAAADRGESRATLATLAFVGAGAATAAGVTFLVLELSSPRASEPAAAAAVTGRRRVRVQPSLDPRGGGGISVSVRF